MNPVKFLVHVLKIIGGLLLLAMMLFTCADIVGSVFGHPILGTEELTALMASVLLAFALPASHLARSHVGVDFLYLKLSAGSKHGIDLFIGTTNAALFGLSAWQCFLYAQKLRQVGEVSMILQLPTYYLIFGVSFALTVLTFLLVAETGMACKRLLEERQEAPLAEEGSQYE